VAHLGLGSNVGDGAGQVEPKFTWF
jgi:hypothetical protein